MSNLNRILVGIRDSKLSRTQTNILLNQLVSVSSEITNESFVIKTIKSTSIDFFSHLNHKLLIEIYIVQRNNH